MEIKNIALVASFYYLGKLICELAKIAFLLMAWVSDLLLSMIREGGTYAYKDYHQQLSLKMQVLRDLNKKAETSGQPKSWKEIRKRMEK